MAERNMMLGFRVECFPELLNPAGVVEAYLRSVISTLSSLPTGQIIEATEVLHQARLKRKQVFIFGNGGSSATAAHFVGDLAKGTAAPGLPRFKAFALTDNISLVTAWANDRSYDDIFVEQLENLASEGDVVIGISGSGNSPNVLKAIRFARRLGAKTIGITGLDGGVLKGLADIAIWVPNNRMEQVEDIHMAVQHAICVALRAKAYGEIELLREPTEALAQMKPEIREILRNLAHDLTSGLEITVSNVLLLDRTGEDLVLWYAHPIRPLEPAPRIGARISLSEATNYAQVLQSKKAAVFRNGDLGGVFSPDGHRANLDNGFKSMAAVALEVGKEVWGVISLAEMRSWERSPITPEKVDACLKLVGQAALDIQKVCDQGLTADF